MTNDSDLLIDRFGDCDVVRDGPVATVTMNRPQKLNAMTRRFWKDMRDIFDLLECDRRTRVVIITGAGDRAFSAGGDIAGFAQISGAEDARAFQQEAMDTFTRVEFSPLTVVAAVNGIAFGGGCELTLACDIAIASDDAKFAMPEARLGLVPGYGVIRAPDVIGRRMTKYLIASAEPISAQRALEIGLVQAMYPKSRLLDEARTLAHKIACNSSFAIAVGKRLINAGIDRALTDYSIEALTLLQVSAERNEGVRAFLEKRTPQFDPPPKGR